MPEQSAADRLRALAASNQHRPDSARLRDILEEVEAALAAGVSRAAIFAELHAAGFTFAQHSFESALYRARRKKKEKVLADGGAANDTKPNGHGHDGKEQPGIFDFGDYLLKIKAGAIWLENADGEAMHVKSEDFRALLDQLFKER